MLKVFLVFVCEIGTNRVYYVNHDRTRNTVLKLSFVSMPDRMLDQVKQVARINSNLVKNSP